MAENMSSDPITVELSFNSQPAPIRTVELNDVGSKSPGKTKKKLIKGSFFRRTSSQDSPSAKSERSSSRKKKISRDSKSGTSSRESLDLLDGPNDAPTSLEGESPRSARAKDYTDSQELEEKSTTELSAKKVHKLNQELLKHNSQLKKSVDTMKKEKFDLLTQNQRLQGEKKTLVKELRRVSSRGEMKSIKAGLVDKEEDLEEKVKQLETTLSVRDRKLSALKARLQKFKLETQDTEFWNDSSDEMQPQVNGHGADLSSKHLAKLEEEKTISSKLREENKELQSRVASLESELEHLQKEMMDLSPQKKSGSLFKRGKRQTASMFVRSSEDILNDKESTRRSKSPESLESSYESQSQSSSKLELTSSYHSTSSPNLSPRGRRRQSDNPDLKTLQSCLKIAIDEKKTLEDCSKRLEEEVEQLKTKVKELDCQLKESQTRLKESQTKLKEVKQPVPNSPETEQLKKQLRMAVSEKTSLSSKCEKLRKELDEVKGKNKSLEQNKNILVAKKDSTIKELEEECEKLKKDLNKAKEQLDEMKESANRVPATVPASNSKASNAPVSSASKVSTSPGSNRKVSTSPGTSNKVSTSPVSVSSKVSTQSVSNSKPVSNGTTVEKSSSPKWMRESSSVNNDKPKEVPEPSKETVKTDSKLSFTTRKTSLGSMSPSSPVRSPKILAAKAMFEEKDSKVEPSSPRQYKRTWSSEGTQRRSSLTTTVLPDIKENQVHHAKSSSIDSTLSSSSEKDDDSKSSKPKSLGVGQSSKATNSPPSTPTKVSKIRVTSSVSPTASPVLNVRKEVKEINVRSPKTEKKEQTFTSTASKPASTTGVISRASSCVNFTTSQSPSFSRVGGIAVTSSATTSTPTTTTTVRTPVTIKKGIESARAQFESKATTPSQAKVMWPSTYYGPTSKTQTSEVAKKPAVQPPPPPAQVAPKPKEEKIVVRRHTTLNVPTTSPVKKASSMQSIPENITDSTSSTDSGSGTSTSSNSTLVEAENKVTVTRSPVPQRIQRRERKDRPKTMYATRSETVSLVKLLSRFQEEEKEKQEKEMKKAAAAAANAESTRVTNGTTSPSASGLRRAPSPVQLRSHSSPRQPRPNTYYGGPTNRGSEFTPTFTSRQTSYEKPKPHERKMVRANTVAFGMGTPQKQSKKASLLRWCQFVTREHDNVRIDNFGESFASGMAFCAILHHFIPDKIPYETLQPTNREQNFRIAFESAESEGIPSLLDVEDMVALPIPDWMSVMTYISFVYNRFGKTASNGV